MVGAAPAFARDESLVATVGPENGTYQVEVNRTAAHMAAQRHNGPKTLELLVDGGANLTSRDVDGHTPLDIAKLNAKVRFVEWIKRHVRANGR